MFQVGAVWSVTDNSKGSDSSTARRWSHDAGDHLVLERQQSFLFQVVAAWSVTAAKGVTPALQDAGTELSFATLTADCMHKDPGCTQPVTNFVHCKTTYIQLAKSARRKSWPTGMKKTPPPHTHTHSPLPQPPTLTPRNVDSAPENHISMTAVARAPKTRVRFIYVRSGSRLTLLRRCTNPPPNLNPPRRPLTPSPPPAISQRLLSLPIFVHPPPPPRPPTSHRPFLPPHHPV